MVKGGVFCLVIYVTKIFPPWLTKYKVHMFCVIDKRNKADAQ